MLEFARIWRDEPKIVFTTTLGRVEWNSRLVYLRYRPAGRTGAGREEECRVK